LFLFSVSLQSTTEVREGGTEVLFLTAEGGENGPITYLPVTSHEDLGKDG
jgi:hypothetical protein